MELEFFEQRPPKVAAIKLDFLSGSPEHVVAEKLRAMPGVERVDVQYIGEPHPLIVLNSQGDSPLRLQAGWSDGAWLVCTPLDTRVELETVRDSEFQRRYRPCGVHADAHV